MGTKSHCIETCVYLSHSVQVKREIINFPFPSIGKHVWGEQNEQLQPRPTLKTRTDKRTGSFTKRAKATKTRTNVLEPRSRSLRPHNTNSPNCIAPTKHQCYVQITFRLENHCKNKFFVYGAKSMLETPRSSLAILSMVRMISS